MPNSKPFSLFVLFFALARERIFTKKRITESRYDIESENRLFAGMSVHFQPGSFTGRGSEGVNKYFTVTYWVASLSAGDWTVGRLWTWTPLGAASAVGYWAGFLMMTPDSR